MNMKLSGNSAISRDFYKFPTILCSINIWFYASFLGNKVPWSQEFRKNKFSCFRNFRERKFKSCAKPIIPFN